LHPCRGTLGGMTPDEAKKRIAEIDEAMLSPDFWNDKDMAQALIKERADLIAHADGGDAHDRAKGFGCEPNGKRPGQDL